jgi:hypothetical protein
MACVSTLFQRARSWWPDATATTAAHGCDVVRGVLASSAGLLGPGRSAITSTVSAIGFTLISLFVIAFALLMVAGTVSLFRDRRPRRAA